jgi:hypothetical protein
VAVAGSVPDGVAGGEDAAPARLDDLVRFRQSFYDCLTARADALFELTDAVLCADGPVTTLVDLSLVAEHRRGHGALYDALNHGRIEVDRLRVTLVGVPLPRAGDGRLVLAVDVSAWLRPQAPTSAQRLFCHVYGRGKNAAQMIPGWPYSFVAALETGRTSWTAMRDAVGLGPSDDATEVTATQLREVVGRLIAAGQQTAGDPEILIVADAGHDITRLAFVLADLPVVVLGRLRSDRVLRLPAPPRRPGTNGRPPHPRRRVRPGPTRVLAHTAAHHQHANHPLRHGDRHQLGSAASPADPPHLLARPRRRTAHHRGHADPPAG